MARQCSLQVVMTTCATLLAQFTATLLPTAAHAAPPQVIPVANLASADTMIEGGDPEGGRERLFRCAPRLRGWEWRLLYSLSDTTAARLHGNGDPWEAHFVTPNFRFSGDGRHVYYSMLRSVHGWEMGSWKPVGDYAVRGAILAMSRDGSKVVVRAPERADADLAVIEPASGRQLAILRGHLDAYAAAFSPDGTLVATASSTAGALRIWQTSSGRLVGSATIIEGRRMRCFRLAWPSARMVAISLAHSVPTRTRSCMCWPRAQEKRSEQ